MLPRKAKRVEKPESIRSEGENAHTYKVLAVSDLHINRIYHTRKSSSLYTHFGNRKADGVFEALKHVDELVINGDMFDVNNTENDVQESLDFDGSDEEWKKNPKEKEQYRLKHRHDPQKFLEHILKRYPHLKVTYVIGNHEAERADNQTEFLKMLEYLRHTYSNFSYTDIYSNSNLLLFHGHSHIEYNHHDEHNGRFYFNVYHQRYDSAKERKDQLKTPVSADNPKKMAETICKTDIVRDFIESRLVDYIHPREEKKYHFYIGFGHRHRAFDETVELEDLPGSYVRVTDLGCTLPTRKTNFKIYHFDHGEVVRCETIDLKKLSKNAETTRL